MAATEPWTSSFEKRSQPGSFDVHAAQYARLRTGYPAAAIDAAVPSDARRVLDRAAGTGKGCCGRVEGCRCCGITTTRPTRWSGTPPFRGHPSFTDPQLTEIAWRREQTIDEEIGLLNAYSYVIRASDRARSELDIRVREILNRHRPGRTVVAVPVICQVWRSTCR